MYATCTPKYILCAYNNCTSTLFHIKVILVKLYIKMPAFFTIFFYKCFLFSLTMTKVRYSFQRDRFEWLENVHFASDGKSRCSVVLPSIFKSRVRAAILIGRGIDDPLRCQNHNKLVVFLPSWRTHGSSVKR